MSALVLRPSRQFPPEIPQGEDESASTPQIHLILSLSKDKAEPQHIQER